MGEVLNDNGYLLLVFKNGEGFKQTSVYNGEEYNRNFVYHTKEELEVYIKNYFSFVEELPTQDNWKFLIYKKH